MLKRNLIKSLDSVKINWRSFAEVEIVLEMKIELRNPVNP